MGLRKRMNGETIAAKTNVSSFPSLAVLADDAEERRKVYSWLDRRLFELGIYAMPNENRPPGFYVNWTTITSLIVVVSAIVGLWYFTWKSADEAGFQRGKAEAEKQQILDRLNKAEEDAKKAVLFGAAQTGDQGPGHEKEKRK